MPPNINAINTPNNAIAIIPAIKRKNALNNTPMTWPMPLPALLANGAASAAKPRACVPAV